MTSGLLVPLPVNTFLCEITALLLKETVLVGLVSRESSFGIQL